MGGVSRTGRDGSGGRCEPHGQRWERWEKYSFKSPTKPARAHGWVCEHEFARNKDSKKLFALHYLTNFYLTVNYFVNILCYKAVNQCSVMSN